MSNTVLLIVFFAMLGLVCLLAPKLIHVLYKEITNLGSASQVGDGSSVASSAHLNTVRIIGIGTLAVVVKLWMGE